MSMEVVPKPPEPDESETPEAPAGSPQSSLRQRAANARKKRYLQRTVPGYEPSIVVRYRAVDPDEIDKIHKRFKKLPDIQAAKKGAAALLIQACLGIFDDVSGKLLSLDSEDEDTYVDEETDEIVGEPIVFGLDRLAELLEIEPGNAERQVYELYPVAGDVLHVSDQVLSFSGVGDKDVEEMIRGNS